MNNEKCRWCKYFDNGACIKASEIFELPDIKGDIRYVIREKGFISVIQDIVFDEAVKKFLNDNVDLDDLAEIIVSEVQDAIDNMLDEIESLSESQSELILKNTDHCCKEFW